jgi:hypothetical protein
MDLAQMESGLRLKAQVQARSKRVKVPPSTKVTKESARRWSAIIEIFAEFMEPTLRDARGRLGNHLWYGFHECKSNGSELKPGLVLQPDEPVVEEHRSIRIYRDVYRLIERNLGGRVGL